MADYTVSGTTSAKANTPCDLGMLYDEDTIECTRPCSDAISGCALCSSDLICYACIDARYTNTALTTTEGVSYTECIIDEWRAFAASDFFVNSVTTSCETECEICSNNEDNSC